MHVSQHQPSVGGGADPGGTGNRSLYVPVRQGPAGSVVRLWRTPFGHRTAVAFTTDRRLRSVLGPTQPWIRLSAEALRRMTEPLGATHLTIDPVLTARPPGPAEPVPDPAEATGTEPDLEPQRPAVAVAPSVSEDGQPPT